jgi:hypothetical protein
MIKNTLAWLFESPVLIVIILVLLVGAALFIEKVTGCHPTYYPGKRAVRQAKKDYRACDSPKVLSKTRINYEKDKYRRSTVMLDVCGEKSRYDCFLSIPFSSEEPATYECREAEVLLRDFLKGQTDAANK